MKTISIRAFQRSMASVLEGVAHGDSLLLTRHDRPMARLLPPGPEQGLRPLKPAQIRAAWRSHRPAVVLCSAVTHAELLRESRGDV